MQKHEIVNNIKIEKLIFGGNWLAIAPDGKKIIISWWAIPGSFVNVKILKSKKNYYEWQLLETVKKSPLEQDLPAHFQVYGGCKWLPINYDDQLSIKEWQVKESFNHIREFVENTNFHPIVASPEIYGYRNKVEFSWGKYISEKEWIHDDFRFWFHKQWVFDRIIDCTYCALADDEINAIFKRIDEFSRQSGLPTYDQKTQLGFWRHLVVRKTHFTQQLMLIFSINSDYPNYSRKEEWLIKVFTNVLAKDFPNIKSIYLLYNTWKADIVTWEFELIFWQKTIKENLLWKTFEINPKSFFQTNSLWAEKLYWEVVKLLWEDDKKWTALDLYAGTGTIGIILSEFFKKVYSVELVKESSEDGKHNAILNNCNNIEFVNAKVEKFLEEFVKTWEKPEVLVIDPPREWMHPDALPNIISFNSKTIIYVSCNPSTLARDLDYILKNSTYKVTDVIPVDMFPHTHHIETIVKLVK